MKRSILLSLLFSFIPFISFAADIDDQINKACLRHAVSLVAQLKNDVVIDLDNAQSDKTLEIATETCQSYFKKEFSHKPETLATSNENNQNEDDGSVNDWLTEKILSDDTERKEGNKRLDRMRNR